MNFKKIISGLMAGVIAASIGVSALAANPNVTWSNGTNLVTEKSKSKTSTGELSEPIITNATIKFDLLLMGANTVNVGASYLALKSAETEVISIKRDGWSTKSYTVAGSDIITYDSSNKDTAYNAHSFEIKLDFVNDSYKVTGTKKETGEQKIVTGTFTSDSIDKLVLYAGKSEAANTATITNLSITTQDIQTAKDYDYTIDPTLEHSDAKGFTAEFTVDENNPVNSLTWYLKKGEGDWKTLKTSELPKPDALSGNIKVGLIVYDLPAGVSANDISAGYTVQ